MLGLHGFFIPVVWLFDSVNDGAGLIVGVGDIDGLIDGVSDSELVGSMQKKIIKKYKNYMKYNLFCEPGVGLMSQRILDYYHCYKLMYVFLFVVVQKIIHCKLL